MASDSCSGTIGGWSLRALFLTTSYNIIFKKFITMAYSIGPAGIPISMTALLGVLLNMTLGVGLLLFNWLFDELRSYTKAPIAVMSSAVVWGSLNVLSIHHFGVTHLYTTTTLVLTIFAASCLVPLRDTIVQRYIKDPRNQCSSFGQYRWFTVLGQLIIAAGVVPLLETSGPKAMMSSLVGLISTSLLSFILVARRGAVDRIMQDNRGQELKEQRSAPSGRVRAWSQILAGRMAPLLASCALRGAANAYFECLLFAVLARTSYGATVLSLSSFAALASEIPFYLSEGRLVRAIGSYERMYMLSGLATTVRIALIGACVVGRPATTLTRSLLIIAECSHGLCQAPLVFSTVHMAHEHSPPGLEVTVQAIFNVLINYGGLCLGCLFFWATCGWVSLGRSYCLAAIMAAASSALCGIFMDACKGCERDGQFADPAAREVRKDKEPGAADALPTGARKEGPVTIRRLVIVVRADPIICGHASEARNLAEAARKQGTEVHIVSWPLDLLEKSGLPLKPEVESYSDGIEVHRPEPVGDDKVLDGRQLMGMAGRLVGILLGEDRLPPVVAGGQEVDVLYTFYLVPHAEIVLNAARAADTLWAQGRLPRRVVTVAKAVGSDITSHVSACVSTAEGGGFDCAAASAWGSAMITFDQFLQHGVLQAVSGYTKTAIMEHARTTDATNSTSFAPRLDQAVEISYPPIDCGLYGRFAEGGSAQDRRLVESVCASYRVEYGRFLLFLSRLMPAKGVDDLLDAYETSKAQAAGLPLLVCGAGPDFNTLSTRAAGKDHVRMVGAVPDSDKLPLMHACLAFVFPSKPVPSFVETFGIAPVEKILAGGPGVVVSTATGGLPEATGGPSCCVEVPAGDVAALRAGIDRACFLGDAERVDLRSSARAHAQRFDRDVIWEETRQGVTRFVARA